MAVKAAIQNSLAAASAMTENRQRTLVDLSSPRHRKTSFDSDEEEKKTKQ